jgi:hypothetical protein
MTNSFSNMMKRTVYAVHILSGTGTLILYLLFLRKEFFHDAGIITILTFFGSAMVSTLWHQTQKPVIKIYFIALSGLALTYIGLWVLLGLFIIR